MFPGAFFIQTRGETGLETLIDAGRLPEVPHFPEVMNFTDLLGQVQFLIDEEHPYKLLAIDTINGAERLCHEHVCQREFSGDFGEKGFTGFMRGFEISLADWRQLLSKLDELREKRKMTVFLLCHTKVSTFKNPEGADYDRYSPDMHAKTWSLTHKWADVVLFGNFSAAVVGQRGKEEMDPSKKGKGKGGNLRILLTERTAAYDAKNRLGLPAEVDMGDDARSSFENFKNAVKAAKESGANGQQ